MSLHRMTVQRGGRALMLVACGLLMGIVVAEHGTARAQAPAPAAPQPPASAAAVPPPQLSADETILALKDAINSKDHVIAQLIEAAAQCRDELTKAERTALSAKKQSTTKPAEKATAAPKS